MLQAVESRRVGHNLVTDQQQQWGVCQEQKAQGGGRGGEHGQAKVPAWIFSSLMGREDLKGPQSDFPSEDKPGVMMMESRG